MRNVTCVRESDGEEMPNSLCAEHIPDNGQQEVIFKYIYIIHSIALNMLFLIGCLLCGL